MLNADVVVVGAGIVGASAAWRLAELGVDVALFDRGEVASGASGVNAGMVDAAGWGSDPDLDTTLRMGSYELFRRVQLVEGEAIGLRRSGSFTAIATEAEWALAASVVDAARQRGEHAELLAGADLRSVEPEASPALLGARWAPIAAQADPAEATRAFARLAGRSGARIEVGCEIRHVRRRGQGFELETSTGTVSCGSLVIAAGAWARSIGRQLGVDLGIVAVRGQMWATPPLPPRVFATFSAMESSLHWTTTPGGDGATTPPQLTHDDDARLTRHLYGRQTRTGEVIVGGDRQLVPAGDPPVTDPAGIEVNRRHAAEVLPFLAGVPLTRSWAGLMPFSLDGRPLLGPIPGVPNAHVAGGLASSGFNRGPMAGRLVADLVAGQPVPASVASADPAGRVPPWGERV